MAGMDAVAFVTLERLLSGDLNNSTAIRDRFLAELARHELSLKRIADPLAESVQAFIYGGLLVTPNSNDVSVSAGVMVQPSATLSPALGPYDSTYRFAGNLVSTTVAMPVPGVTTYYLIEAQMTPVVTTTVNRDIFDPGTETFTPTSTQVVIERQVQFQVVAGGASAPSPTGGDWVPIAIVRRPGGGGPVVSSDIIDVRLLPSDRRAPIPELRRNNLDTFTPAANLCVMNVDYDGPGGRRAYVGTPDLSAASIVSPSVTLAAGTRYFLYLAPWSAYALNPRQQGTLSYEGVLVLSDVAPDSTGRNTAPIGLPAPFAVVSAGTGTAYLVGTVFRNGGNTDFVSMVREGSRTRVAAGLGAPLGNSFAPPTASNVCAFPWVPPTAKEIDVRVVWNGAGSNTCVLTSSGDFYSVVNDAVAAQVVKGSAMHDGTTAFTLAVTGVINAGTTASVNCEGWRE